MTNQLERLTTKQWADQFGMSPTEYSDEVERVKRELELAVDNEFWAAIVNRYQVTSAKKYQKTIRRLLDWGNIHGIDEDMYLRLIRLNDGGWYDYNT